MFVSVVIPTYNRGAKLAATLDHLLASEVQGLDEVEIIVVDDGSLPPALSVVESRSASAPFSLRCIRQTNAGPAAARNNGFRNSSGEIVLFMDDDVLCPPGLIRQHVDAHLIRAGSVVFGGCSFVSSDRPSPLFRYVNGLANDAIQSADAQFVSVGIVASGQISVERRTFDDGEAVYRDNLATPAAEEYELSWRLRKRGIPMLFAREINALHDHPVELAGMCRQAYKHGKGCAEAVVKCPETMALDELRRIVEVNGPRERGEPRSRQARKLLKAGLSVRPMLSAMRLSVNVLERVLPSQIALAPLYRGLMGSCFFSGVRAGFAEYTKERPDPRHLEPAIHAVQ